jgi:hypothetical protein
LAVFTAFNILANYKFPLNEALANYGGLIAMKVFILTLCLACFNVLAGDTNKLDYSIDFSGVLLKQPKMSKIQTESLIINKYIQENYSQNNQFYCGGTYNLTPDQGVKFAYERGMLEIVSEFGHTHNIQAYTPIRQLVQNPEKDAVFNGYYFISSKR